ncbi:Rab5 GDP/GTP exchange factor [Entomortierella parvispora]|uniref:Rab5 GDP/GTP exchange factor n=1 Tax=Entomortierella parvispora TaxID=205924 RepID=A0A9P3LTV6_9FUNG|nr:Rab5 GDP/GTP exchange factor [Entomortierella parvispora]
MSLLDDEDEDWKRLGKAMQGTSLGDRVDAASGQPNAAASSTQDKSHEHKDTPETADVDRELVLPPGSITFAPDSPDTAASPSGNEGDTQTPRLSRRKSSMTTIGSKLNRAASTEKHVTILDAQDNNNKVMAGEPLSDSSTEDGKDKEEAKQEEEATKQELSKILMQFDPLVEDAKKKGGKNSVEAITAEDSIQNATATLSPSMSLSSSSSPKTPQQLDSPRTSHDVQVAMAEKAKSSSLASKSSSSLSGTNKKKSERKSALSPERTTVVERGMASGGGSSGNNNRSEPAKPKEIPFDFHKFLEQMRHRSAIPITRYFQSFLKEFDRKPWTVNEQIKIIHDFLDFITGKMEMCDLWKNTTDQEFENVKEGMEKLVMNRLFAYTFSPSTTDDAERDEVLTQKVRIFRWVRESHLDIPDSPHNEAYLNNAQAELKKINSYKAPRDKVICILNCCKFIFTLIRRSEGNSKGADTFLPILIYVVLRANPPNMVSNVQYISRFRNPDKLQAEAGYYLASLMGAISFIENLEASSLSVSPEEFDRQIEKTMAELSQEKADAIAAEAASRAAAAATSSSIRYTRSPEPGTGHKKQESKLATLLAGTSGTRSSSRHRPPIDEKQFLQARSSQQQSQSQQQQLFDEKSPSLTPQQSPHHSSRSGPESSSNLMYKSSPSISSGTGSSIINPAAALIERGANFASKTMQKPLDLIERIFLDSSGDEEEMAKPYPPRVASAPGASAPPLPQRTSNTQIQQQQRPDGPARDDSFTEFVYVPHGQQIHQPSPQQFQQQPLQPTFHQQGQLQQQYPGQLHHHHQQQHYQQQQQQQQHSRERTQSGGHPLPPVPQQQSMEEYLKALETLTDMFPSCEREVCDVILQANDGRLSPSIDTLLEISSASDVGGQTLPPNPERALEEPASERDHEQEGVDDGEVPVTNLLDLSPIETQENP